MRSGGRDKFRRNDKPQGISRGLGSLLNGLIAAAIVALSVLVAVVLGAQEQDLLARVEPTATRALPSLTATVTPMPNITSLSSPTAGVVLIPTASSTVLPPTASPTQPPTSSPTPTLSPTPPPTPSPKPTRPPAVRVVQSTRVPSAPKPCVKRTDWVLYEVVKGDTLTNLAGRTGTSVKALKKANCMSGNLIIVGQSLRVPKLPPPLPTGTSAPPTLPPTEAPTEPPPPPTGTPPEPSPEPPTPTP